MRKYIRYEIEKSDFYGRDRLMGIWIDEKGKTHKDYLLCFGSKISREENTIELEKLCYNYNSKT